MSKTFYTITSLLFSTLLFGQVGINTPNPKGVFNIDAGRDNPTTGSAHTVLQQLNDFVVNEAGNVGLGTIAPVQKLDIRTNGTQSAPITGFKLVDGNQNKNFVLTSDANGIGTWKPTGMRLLTGTFVSNDNHMAFATSSWQQTGANITIPPGVWRIDLTEIVEGRTKGQYELPGNAYCFIRFSLSESSSNTGPLSLTGDFVRLQSDGTVTASAHQFVSTPFEGPVTNGGTTSYKFAIANGNMTIRNSSSTNKTYYIASQIFRSNVSAVPLTNFNFQSVGGNWGENAIYATPITLP